MGGITAGISRRKGAEKQREAALAAQANANRAIDEERARQEGAFNELGQANRDLSGQAQDQLQFGYNAANSQLSQAGIDALGQLRQGLSGETEALRAGFGAAGDALSGAAGRGRFSPGEFQRAGGLGELNLSDFETSPGFEFRRQQGEGAINRLASARGGRLSGRTLQELASFNQGLASEEFNNFANRRLAERGQNLTARGQDINQNLGARGQDIQVGLGNQGSLDNLALNQANLSARGGEALGGAIGAGNSALANAFLATGQGLADLSASGGQALANATQSQLANALGLGAQEAQINQNLLTNQINAINAPVGTAGAVDRARAETGQNNSVVDFAKNII